MPVYLEWMRPAMPTILRRSIWRLPTIVAAVVSVGVAAFAQQRPVTKGVALAYPQQQSVEVPVSMTIGLPHEIRIPVDITVSELGKVKFVKLPFIEDSVYRGSFDSLLAHIEFVPGLRNGEPSEQILPLDLALRPGATRLGILSPVSADSLVVTSAAEYACALDVNKVPVPKIQKLGPYGFPGIVPSTAVALPSVVARISVSQSGRPRNVEIVNSTIEGQNDQLQSLLNWATFVIDAKPATATEDYYAAFVFHPGVSYPTKRFSAVAHDTIRSARDFLVQILPDTLGLLVPPLPRLFTGDSVSIAEATKKLYGRVAIDLDIDTAGLVTIKRISRKERPVKRLVDLTFGQLTFYPALGFDGRPRSFSGLLYLDFEGSAIIRVHAAWLRNRTFQPIR